MTTGKAGKERNINTLKKQNEKENEGKVKEHIDVKMASTFFLKHIHSPLTTSKIKVVHLNISMLKSSTW